MQAAEFDQGRAIPQGRIRRRGVKSGKAVGFSQGGEGKMSSPAWQFQMGDPDALNAGPRAAAEVAWAATVAAAVATVVVARVLNGEVRT